MEYWRYEAPDGLNVSRDAGAGTDPDRDALDYRISQMPVHGTLEGFGKDLVYTPHPDFAGADAFTFVVSDGNNVSDPAIIQIAVQ